MPLLESYFESAFLRAYDDLRSTARQIRSSKARQCSEHRTTSLVHEAYLRLAKSHELEFHDEAHLRRIAARAMRYFLVDGSRRFGSARRGSGQQRLRLTDVDPQAPGCEDCEVDVMALSDALTVGSRDTSSAPATPGGRGPEINSNTTTQRTAENTQSAHSTRRWRAGLLRLGFDIGDPRATQYPK